MAYDVSGTEFFDSWQADYKQEGLRSSPPRPVTAGDAVTGHGRGRREQGKTRPR